MKKQQRDNSIIFRSYYLIFVLLVYFSIYIFCNKHFSKIYIYIKRHIIAIKVTKTL